MLPFSFKQKFLRHETTNFFDKYYANSLHISQVSENIATRLATVNTVPFAYFWFVFMSFYSFTINKNVLSTMS